MSELPSWYGSKLPPNVEPPASYSAALILFGWKASYQDHNEPDRCPPEWEARMVAIQTPEPLVFSGIVTHRVRLHPYVAQYASRAFQEIADEGLWPLCNPYAGAFNFRLQRGGDKLSAHSFGAGLDFDAGNNPMGKPPAFTRIGGSPEGERFVKIWESWGWYWGGRFSRPDSMHFQWGYGW